MEFLSDILLAAAAIGAAIFCLVLSRRLRALSTLDNGMGSAIAILSSQVDDLSRALKSAQATAGKSAETLDAQTRRAENACRQIELLMASLHDLPAQPARMEGNTPPDRAHSPSPPPAPAPESGHLRPLSKWKTAAAQRPAPATDTGRPRLLRRRSPEAQAR